jgi:hypothetical protein
MVLSLREIKIVYNLKKKFDIILPSDIPIEESSLSESSQELFTEYGIHIEPRGHSKWSTIRSHL